MPIVPPPLPSYLATETVALNERLKPATRRGVGSSLWNAEQIRSVPGALDGLALLRAWLEHTALVLEPSFAFVHCFDLAKADFVTVATQGTPAEAAYGIRLKSSDPVLAAALRSSGLVDVPAVRARNALRYKTNEFSTAVSIAMAGAGRVLGVIELAFTAPLQAAQRLELDASVRALGQALDRRGIPLDKLEAP